MVLIPFVLAFFGSFKTSEDITTYPPRLLPFAPTTAQVDGKDVPLFTVTVGSFSADLAQVAGGGSAGEYRSVATNEQVVFAKEDQVQPTGATVDVGRREQAGRQRTRPRAAATRSRPTSSAAAS